jgi:hypothetical protein
LGLKKHTSNGHRRRRRGRPTRPETTELIASLILRQLALAHRTATRINQILDVHVRRGDVARLRVRLADEVRARMSTLADHIRARLKLDAAGMAVIEALLDEALQELAVSPEERALAALPHEPEEPHATAEPVENLAAARAQAARLHARLIGLRERVARPGVLNVSVQHVGRNGSVSRDVESEP